MSETYSGYSQTLPETKAPSLPSLPATRVGVLRVRVLPAHVALAAILTLSALLDTWRLSQNGYANTFYSAGVRSMLDSLHNFVFVSFDPGGLVTIDKPPLALWVQGASAKLFGFGPLSLILPESIMGVLSVALLYRIVSRRLGTTAGLLSALALAVFPSFVAISRENGVDPLLILLMILACGACLTAIENGRMRSLLWSGVLVGLAFNTKTLAAWLVVPALALGYVVCAPGPLSRRVLRVCMAGLVMGVVSFGWIAFVELTPTSQRPYVGSSQSNTELGLTFKYNGFGRVEGEKGGFGGLRSTSHLSTSAAPRPKPLPAVLPDGRERGTIPFGGSTGPLRLFDRDLGDQDAWTLPLALAGLLALALVALERPRTRANPKLAVLIVFGGWLLVEMLVLSFSKGIVHPYYVSALGPGAAVMLGAGTASLESLPRRFDLRTVLLAGAVTATVAVQALLLHQQRYAQWLIPFLIATVAVGLTAIALRRFTRVATVATVLLLLIAPAAYSATTWLAPVEGTLPMAGPRRAAGDGYVGVNAQLLMIDRQLTSFVDAHKPTSRWSLLTEASITAAPFILFNMHAGAIGGYGATDPVLDGAGLARLVSRGEARYVLLGGAYADRGGNRAIAAVATACRAIPAARWRVGSTNTDGLVLFDCGGREAQLRRPHA